MKIAVVGGTHLARVTAACLAKHHDVVRFGQLERVTDKNGVPAHEPGLVELEAAGAESGRLRSVVAPEFYLADLIWLCEDLPVDRNDRGDVEAMIGRCMYAVESISSTSVVVISSQVPLGTTYRVQRALKDRVVAYVPENLRRGQALDRFMSPDRVIIGSLSVEADRAITEALSPFTRSFISMQPHEAEMVKHAINGYLALCITYVNELKDLCESQGVDVKAVEAGMRSDKRIGYEGPLTPGGPIRGGTLLRDVQYLCDMSLPQRLQIPVIGSIWDSNKARLERDEVRA